MSFDFDTLEIQTPGGGRTAMVITPLVPLVVDARVPTPGHDALSEVDNQILEGAKRAAATHATVCIFRARAPVGEGAYSFDPTMSEDQAVQTALAMMGGQMRIYRAMLRMGICLFLHTDLGLLEVQGLRGSVDLRIAQLEPTAHGDSMQAKRAELDLWMLRNLIFFFSLGFDKLIATILPDKLTLMEKRMERIRRLAQDIE